MNNWKSIGDIISKFNFKGKAKKELTKELIKERIQRVFNIKEDFKVDFSNGKLEIYFKSTFFAQEFFFEKEKIKKEIQRFLKENNISENIKEVFIRKI